MKRIYAISPKIYYSNEEFQKDSVLVPYAFYKAFGIEPVIVAAQKEEYVYAKSMPGLVVDVQKAPEDDRNDLWTTQMKEYIFNHIQDMDILFCIGSYFIFWTLVPYYKQLKPEGKVILKLDINAYWQDKLTLQNKWLRRLYDNCDLITCEGKRIKRFLSKKWPYEIDYLTNGCLELPNETIEESYYDEKENIILPGKIVDQKKLNEEYRKAKIFIMTSYCEGMPNVIQEAAQHGCYMVCSQIDAANEFTNWERCGKVFPIGDINSLIKIFDRILLPEYDEIMRKSSCAIRIYHRRYFDYIVEVKKMMHLLRIKGNK